MENKKVALVLLGAATVAVGIYVAANYYWIDDDEKGGRGDKLSE